MGEHGDRRAIVPSPGRALTLSEPSIGQPRETVRVDELRTLERLSKHPCQNSIRGLVFVRAFGEVFKSLLLSGEAQYVVLHRIEAMEYRRKRCASGMALKLHPALTAL